MNINGSRVILKYLKTLDEEGKKKTLRKGLAPAELRKKDNYCIEYIQFGENIKHFCQALCFSSTFGHRNMY